MKKNKKEIHFYIRKSWDDVDSQIGIEYSFFANAKKACDKVEGYSVFNSLGELVYPYPIIAEEPENAIIETPAEVAPVKDVMDGAMVKLLPDVTYSSGKVINKKLFDEKLYVVEINPDSYGLSRSKNGAIIGRVNKSDVEIVIEEATAGFEPFVIQVLEDETSIYAMPRDNAKIINHINKYSLFTIVSEKDGFGKMKKGAGWIKLDQVKKL